MGRAIVALVLLVVPTAARAQSEPALWRFADPNSKSIIGIDWARVRNSAAGSMIRQTLPAPEALPGLLVMQVLDSIDRVLISSPAGPAAPGSDTDSENSPILIAIQGRFDPAHVRQLFINSGAKPQTYNSFQVYRPQAKTNRSKISKDSAWVLYDAHTILFGDAPLVFAALDRNEFGPPAGTEPKPGSLAARAANLDAKYEIWGILDIAEVASSEPLAAVFHDNEWASALQGVEGGLNLGLGLDADFILHLASDEAAKHVAADLASALTAAAKDKSVGVEAQDLAKKLRFSAEGSTAKVSLHMNQQELDQITQAFKAGVQSGERATTNSSSAPAPAFAPAIPAKPPVIRIEGLDEGTREIPYRQPEQ
jgi:hypothetical protein